MDGLVLGDDGVVRCGWSGGSDLYRSYHDDEWGRPVVDDARLFEKLVLEGFQAGLSWITILRKREAFREVFRGFDPGTVSAFDAGDVDRMLGDPRIIRHRGKIEAAIGNARAAVSLAGEWGGLAPYFWQWSSQDPAPSGFDEIPAYTPASTALSKDLKRRGWRFVGPTTVYAFMQAMGLVNDHLAGCPAGDRCRSERLPVMRRYRQA